MSPTPLSTLLITLLAIVALYSPHRSRRGAAEKIFDRLLAVVSKFHQQEITLSTPRRQDQR